MRVVIRVDSSPDIGTGHLERCLALARGMQGAGAEVHFLFRNLMPAQIGRLQSGRFILHQLADTAEAATGPIESEYGAWLRVSQERDAEATLRAVQHLGPVDVLVVDHYALDAQWERRVKGSAARLVAIDDLANRPHYVDFLLDQNLGHGRESRYRGLVPSHCRLLLGPRYSLLRDDFLVQRMRGGRPRSGVGRILVAFGGVDLSGMTVRTLKVLLGMSTVIGSTAVDVLVGEGNIHRDEIRKLAEAMPGTNVHVARRDIAELMGEADLCIGAGGTMTWERACVGLPAISFSIAANQGSTNAAMAEAGAIIHLEEDGVEEVLPAALTVLMRAPALLVHMSRQAMALVDGRGVERAVSALLHRPLVAIRLAKLDDCDMVYAWRNDESVRAQSLDPAPILLEAHRTWYRHALQDPSRILLIGEVDGCPVGMVRYDLKGAQARVSVFLAPGMTGRGIGSGIVREGTLWLQRNRITVERVVAEVLDGNVASRRAFESAGYAKAGALYSFQLRSQEGAKAPLPASQRNEAI